jgi:hypothetical protein
MQKSNVFHIGAGASVILSVTDMEEPRPQLPGRKIVIRGNDNSYLVFEKEIVVGLFNAMVEARELWERLEREDEKHNLTNGGNGK